VNAKRRPVVLAVAAALAVSLAGPGGAELNQCSDCLLDGGDDGGDGPTTFAADVTVGTEEETTTVTVDTDLESTDAWFDGSDGHLETVEDEVVSDLNPLEGTVTVHLNTNVHEVLTATTPYHYTSTYFNVVAQNATEASNCEGKSAWEAHYLDYDEGKVDPKAPHTVNVTWDYLRHDEFQDHTEWNSSYSEKTGNPVVHKGSKTWNLGRDDNGTSHYHVYYNMSVDGERLRGTDPFEIGESAKCTN
jgi:hypothetical protein